ncbi:hypothetical protein [Niveibacterium sp. SC-1]|uniref:hypothetical protein n=1 Tax=Niveibacterium sp. SC-1 TaxID=3135646 RepID=UPI00311F61D5
MNRILTQCLAAAALALAASSASATDVGVSVSVGQPGFYGHIDIGNMPRPVVVYPEPVVIQPVPVGVVRQPVYLRVPPGHAKNWSKHCAHYNACGRPVYFVDDRWYQEQYVPRYQEQHGHGHHDHHDHDDDHDHDHGHGKGHGKGHH